MPEKFELIGKNGDINGVLYMRYGSGIDDPKPFLLTLTPQYVARAIGKTPPITFREMDKYADQHAKALKAEALVQKNQGSTTLILD